MARIIVAYLLGSMGAGFWLSACHFLLAGQELRPSSVLNVLGYGAFFSVVIVVACLIPVLGAKLLWGERYPKPHHRILFGGSLGALWSVLINALFWAEPEVLFAGYLIAYTSAGVLAAAVFVYIKGEMKPAY